MKAQTVSVRKPVHLPLPMDKTALSIAILLILIFSKYIYMASLTSYYTFYLIHKFNVSVQDSQLYLFIFLVATAIGTLIGGPVGDRIGRKYVIWASILGAAPFAMMGFVRYHGMNAEQFVWAFIKSEFLLPKRLIFQPENLYYEILKPCIENHEKEELKQHD